MILTHSLLTAYPKLRCNILYFIICIYYILFVILQWVILPKLYLTKIYIIMVTNKLNANLINPNLNRTITLNYPNETSFQGILEMLQLFIGEGSPITQKFNLKRISLIDANNQKDIYTWVLHFESENKGDTGDLTTMLSQIGFEEVGEDYFTSVYRIDEINFIVTIIGSI